MHNLVIAVNSNEDPDRQVLKLSMYPEISSMSGQRLLTTTPVKHGTKMRKLNTTSQTKAVQSYLLRNVDCYNADQNSLSPLASQAFPTRGRQEKVCGKTSKEWYHYLRSVTPTNPSSHQRSPYKLASDYESINQRPNTTRMVATGHPCKRVGKLYMGYAGTANIALSRQSTL